MRYRSPLQRAAFTLIELLVVIAIIAVLTGLVVVGVLPMLSKGPDIKDVNEISQLSNAAQMWKNKFGVKFPIPSRIKLCNNRSEYGTTTLDTESLGYLNQIWPRLGNFTNADWAGNGATLTSASGKGEILDGDQCLVFFLGGPQGTNGFSTSASTPWSSAGDRVKFYDFNPSRLNLRNGSNFPSYVDSYGTGSNRSGTARWYMYFSSGRKANGYQTSHAITVNRAGGGTDTVQPIYLNAASTRFQNPDSFQIITAGLDGEYGSLTEWNNGAGTSTTQGWQDNRTNFSPNKLIAGNAN